MRRSLGCEGPHEARAFFGSWMEIGYVIRDVHKREVDPGRSASKFDAGYYRGLLEKARAEASFVFSQQRVEGGLNV
jgi:hypothetical protein